MTFRLSQRSMKRLEGVHPDLVKVVQRAIEVTEVDFGVLEGRRSLARQRKLVEAGASTTMRSRHLTGHAVDLGAYIGSRVAWDWPLYHKIAAAMKQASTELDIPLEWGGAWGRLLNDFSSADLASESYTDERRSQGRKPFLDGPHYQLPWENYP